MRDEAIRVRAVPARESVGGEALMHHRERAGEFGIDQIGKKLRNLRRYQLTLINDGDRGQTAHVEQLWIVQVELVERFIGRALANDVELALERGRIGDRAPTADEDLPKKRHRTP